MKNRILRSVLAIALLVWVTPALAQKAQVIDIPLSRPGEPIYLEIDIQSAHIEVIGEDREDATFEVLIEDGERHIVTPSGTQPLRGGGYALEVEEEDNNISLDTDWRTNKVTVLARVPRNADLALGTIDDGEIIVRNITGNLELSNVNGPITVENLSGSIIAEAVNDTINVSFDRIDDANATSLESINGDLFVGLPAGTGAQFYLDSGQGEIFSDFEVDVEPSSPVVERDDDEGGVSIRIESAFIAKVNGGGPVIRMKTLYGDIHIKKAN